jgi:PAS domain S-box-containing protein
LVYVSDIKTYDLLFANRKLLEYAGLSPSEIKGKKCWEVIHSRNGPCPFCPVQRLLADKNLAVYEREHYDESINKWFLSQGSLIRWADGRSAHFEIATDVSKLKAYEEKMKHLSAIISTADAGIIVSDRRGVIQEWNIGATHILGYEREEVIGKSPKEFNPREVYGAVENIISRILGGEHIHHPEEMRIHKDGKRIFCSITYTPIMDNKGLVSGYVSIFHDISERVKKDKDLKKSYHDTEAILEELPAPICVVRRNDGIILGCNKAFVKLCGAGSEEELKNNLIEHHIVTDDEKNVTNINALLIQGLFNSFLKKQDGSLVEIEVFAKPFMFKEQIAYAVCCIDVTGKRLQEDILREAVLNAEETSRLKSMFLANMSHEIRTPMNGIIGLTELALDSGGLSEKTTDYLSKIKSSAVGLLAIINDILDISKIEAGKTELENVVFTLGDVFKSCEAVSGVKEKGKNVKLIFNCGELAAEKVIGDPTKLKQIFMNLLSNAIKFTNYGSVELSAQLMEKNESALVVSFAVKDTGIGMDANQVKRALEPFAQADVSTTRKYGGTGLGLTITNNLLEMMDSALSIESQPGIGSIFSFMLTFEVANKAAPITVDFVENLENNENMNRRPIFSAEALVCEDNSINRQVIEEHLMRIGINPVIAENGKIGVNMAKTRMRTGKPFDIILMDIHMPVMDGLEAMQKLIEAGSRSPVVAMTARAMPEDRELVIRTGMSDYICKPFTARDLWSCLLRFLKPVRFEDITPDGTSADKNEIIDGVSGLEKSAGDPGLYNRIKTDFYFKNIDTVKSVEQAVAEGDFVTAHRIAHTLKGVALLIGANMLGEAAFTLEKFYAAHKEDNDALNLVKQRMDAVLALLKPLADKEADEKADSTVTEINLVKAFDIINRLEPLLKEGSSEATDLAVEVKKTFSKELSKELVECLLDYEFDAALKELERIKRQLEGKS